LETSGALINFSPNWICTMNKFILSLVAIALGLAEPQCFADTTSIGASRDVTIFQNPANNSNGLDNGLFVGTNGNSSPRRALIGFNIAGSLPAGATIQAVSLKLTFGLAGGTGSGSPTVDLFRVTADWGEGLGQTAGGTPDQIGGQGNGVAAATGDATWNARMFNTANWTTTGGDFATPASAGLQIVGNTAGTAYTWPSTAALVSDVQSWLDSPTGNFGWILKNQEEATAQTFRAFYSRNTATASFRPELTITYAVPEPRTMTLTVLAAAGVFLLPKRRAR
jgi:hypothetical protein